MKSKQIVQWMATGLSVTGLCVPMQTIAAGEVVKAPQTSAVSPAVKTTDVVAVAGKLTGRVVDSNGKAIEGAQVAVLSGGKKLHETITNADGAFTVSNMKNGVYQINAGNASGIYRVWNEQTAPPAAMEQAVLVSDDTAVRGQMFASGPLLGSSLGTILIVGAVATAIAVPVVINNNDNPPTSP